MPVALVTGSGVRVGNAIARALGQAGFDLVLHVHRSRDGADRLASELAQLGRRAQVVVADLTSEAGQREVREACAAFAPSLDLLVNNSAAYESVPFRAITRAQYDDMMALNTRTPFFLTQALLPLLEKSHGASVVCITDVATDKPYAGYLHYLMSKSALDMFVRALALELAPAIRVNGVAPGIVAFPVDFDEAKRASILRKIPLRREGHPDDIAKAVVFLAKDATYATGEIIHIGGGLGVS